MIIVSDTSVLSNLAVIEQLPLLQQLYNNVIIPQAVRNELSNASPENINIRAGSRRIIDRQLVPLLRSSNVKSQK